MGTKLIFGIIMLFYGHLLLSQGVVAIGGNDPDSSAIIHVTSADKGVLLPRMTFADRNAIADPAEGLLVYCIDCGRDGAGLVCIFQGGEWLDMNLSCYEPLMPGEGTHIASVTQITWIWEKSHITLGYKWNSTNDYNTSTDLGLDTSITETGLTCGTDYTRYVWAYNDCGHSSSSTITKQTSMDYIDPPVESVHAVTLDSIIWKWRQVTGATGYKWNSVDDYATAEDRGTDTTRSDTGLACGTIYTRYTWAYNACGYSMPVTLADTTLLCCGTPFTITHTAGSVAPVTKTTTYGTVNNIPGETVKCWITSNLGSDHQATAVNDATEPSAGWHWQFNLKQGYKHDGTTRTPNTPWITGINENSDWLAENDPCAILLSNTWRMPTYTEWYNVDYTGGWSNWNHAWASALKLHAAGWIQNTGSISQRGLAGYYWSILQSDTTHGYDFSIFDANSAMYSHVKEDGFSLRCIRDE